MFFEKILKIIFVNIFLSKWRRSDHPSIETTSYPTTSGSQKNKSKTTNFEEGASKGQKSPDQKNFCTT